jgi:hypothetical protein
MNIIEKFVAFVMKIYMWSGAYGAWSRFYQRIWESQRLPVEKFSSLDELGHYMQKFKWRADGWRQLGDAISHPEHVQWLMTTGAVFIGDCEDFACYEVSVAKTLKEVKSAKIMTIIWHSDKYEGHNVCLIEYMDGTLSYMDYGPPSRSHWFKIEDVVSEVLSEYAPGATLLGVYFMDEYGYKE